ncbi:hypothetical protein CEY16_07645 [Halalkalibacillus sediminis]|uniref:Transposase IS204/IS1001/IS1096/IS1165 DDE domain-containing protein n=1 Tax=Halalkalibacillus sediminis TaxID=2018042 RepID=A0A2I0QTZ6_9BACI|nr:hypothetical protein CEY16_07645 [Halalkalibacillus sediminis]
MKRSLPKWFESTKQTGPEDLDDTRNRLYGYYELVQSSGIHEFAAAIKTFKNWQKNIMSSFEFDLHNGYVEGINNHGIDYRQITHL